ncbi:DUF58 domain-containing protein [Methylobrevis albus]|uniref:DUF58 domain-containing protein n=1 Tax=Methylobrevis albus TaxID=2793297 RepID=A0A931I4D0_9HYPH|nr:DUF58 domain-containing protein [Methylobrevis albus]MBH0239254.1 DUF58 domain-containing protein [Methylobrevis albus]
MTPTAPGDAAGDGPAAELAPSAGTTVEASRLLALRHVVARSRIGLSRRTASLPGPVITRRRGRGSETDEIRLWAHGDDMRHIDRNSTARTGEPHVRTFRDEREQATLLVADFRPPMLFGTRRAFRSVACAEILALTGWRAVESGGRVALVAAGADGFEVVRPGGGDRAMTAVAGGLARAHAAALTSSDTRVPGLADALDAAVRLLPRGGSILLATGLDAPGDDFDEALLRARWRCDVKVALVIDAFERRPPAGSFPFVTFAGRRGLRVVGRRPDPPEDDRLARLHRLGADAVEIDASLSPEDQLASLGALHASLG